jgi:tRNA threonylcarbamoyladenosine biosynthesis protein TsaB
MSLLIAIESSTSVCSVTLCRQGAVISTIALNQPNVHAQKLVLLIEQLFEQTGLVARDLDAVAVSAGPGSYTGLRIGVSVAKGLSYALEIPLIAVDTLKALAWQALSYAGETDVVIPMMDARRMEVYAAAYGKGGKQLMATQALILDHNPFDSVIDKGKAIYIGDGVAKAKEVLAHPDAVFLNLPCCSRTVASLAYAKYEKKEFEDKVYFEPNYLKDFRILQSKKNPLLL